MTTVGGKHGDTHTLGLYRIAAVTTLMMTGFFLFDTACWIVMGPYPNSIEGWFTVLQNDRSIGLLLLSFPTLFGMVLYSLTLLGLRNTLRQVNSAYATFALLLGCAGLTILLATNAAYPIVDLADRYVTATTDAHRTLLLAAGEASMVKATAGANMGGALVEGALVIFSLLMLRSTVFGVGIATLGLLGHGLDLARLAMNLVFLPERIGAVLLMIGGLPQLIWLLLVARKFWQLGSNRGAIAPSQSA